MDEQHMDPAAAPVEETSADMPAADMPVEGEVAAEEAETSTEEEMPA